MRTPRAGVKCNSQILHGMQAVVGVLSDVDEYGTVVLFCVLLLNGRVARSKEIKSCSTI